MWVVVVDWGASGVSGIVGRDHVAVGSERCQ